jgi:Asp/Glu/hydantoin racemase
MIEEQIVRYGLRERIVSVKAITSNPTDLVQANDDPAAFERILNQFREEVQPLLNMGVEVIIPGGGLPAMLLSRLKHFTVGGALVLNPIAVLAKMTEMAVKLYRLNGTRVSRASTYAKASEKAVHEFLERCP